jgi:hypothetical protein
MGLLPLSAEAVPQTFDRQPYRRFSFNSCTSAHVDNEGGELTGRLSNETKGLLIVLQVALDVFIDPLDIIVDESSLSQ